MIQITVNKTCASVQNLEPITSGTVNAKVQVTFDSTWDGLNKTAVFTNGAITKDVLESQWEDGNIITIPHEVLTPNAAVKMGVYGYNFVNGIASAVPSVYVKLAKVRVGADPLADITTDPTLPVYAQLQWEIDHFEISPEQIAEQVQEYLEEHPIEIQPATATVLGGVKAGNGLSVTSDGTLSADVTADDLDELADIVDEKLSDAPSDGKQYARKDGAWSEVESGGYEPPVGGIPYEDLSSDVQESLDKAGSALQEDDLEEAETVELADVATSGDYNDLSNKPTIPTVPTAVSAFTNDIGYLTLETLPKYNGEVE